VVVARLHLLATVAHHVGEAMSGCPAGIDGCDCGRRADDAYGLTHQLRVI